MKMISKLKLRIPSCRMFSSIRQAVIKAEVTPSMFDEVPSHIARPEYLGGIASDWGLNRGKNCVHLDPVEIRLMKEACQIAAEMRELAGSMVKPGITTDEIDKAVFKAIIKQDAYPSALGYMDFPKSLCSSINEVACHGIPDLREIQEGDVVKFDVVVFKNGFHGDCCGTFYAGDRSKADPKVLFLVDSAKEVTHKAIQSTRAGSTLSEIGGFIEDLSDQKGLEVCKHFCGHGIGRKIHCAPLILHHRNDDKTKLENGMFITIEPILAEGSGECIVWEDNWTVATKDGSRAAQHEETIRITEQGYEILTKC